MAKRYTAVLKIMEVDLDEVAARQRGPFGETPNPRAHEKELTTITIRGSSLEAIKVQIATHVNLIEA